MAQAKNGDTVRIHYTGKFADGRVFEASVEEQPLQFTLGEEQVITDLEHAVVGMTTGESKTIEVMADNAYGPYRDELVFVLDRDRLPENLQPEVGQDLIIREGNDTALRVTVIDVSESSVALDANHPLAGKDLTIDIHLVEIV
jgi:FKBP-type peptidyl-prolyl cis-trans isomerase 2